MPTIQELAREVYSAREVKHRGAGAVKDEELRATFVCLRDGSPEWMSDLMGAAHDDRAILPDDWRYACAFAACEAIVADDSYDIVADGVEDIAHEFADGYVDVYTSELVAWLASSNRRMAYCDEAVEEFGEPSGAGSEGIEGRIRAGQYLEAREVFESVARFLAERVEEVKKVERSPNWNGRCAVVEMLYGNQCTLTAGHEGKHNIEEVEVTS